MGKNSADSQEEQNGDGFPTLFRRSARSALGEALRRKGIILASVG